MASMETGPLLHFEPHELSFTFELNTQLSSSLRLFNRTDDHVFFKLLTTKPKKYGVRPRIGILPPGSDCEITVTTRAPREAPESVRCKDKFLIRTAVAGPGATAEDAQNMFNREAGDVFHECILRVIYVSPQPGVLTPVADETTRSPSRASTSENANPNLPEVLSFDRSMTEDANPGISEVMSSDISRIETDLSEGMNTDLSTSETNLSEVLTSNISTTGNENPNHPEAVISDNEPATNVMQQKENTRKLLHVQPLELHCPLKLKKENQCSLHLSNLTENHVAFLVKNASSKYFAHPDVGIILPNSTCEIAVRMQEESSVQSDTQCEDKFLIHSFVAIPAAIKENITPEMFNRGGSTIEDCDMQVVRIIPQEHIANHKAELFIMVVIVCLLFIVSWYLMKQTVFLLWSVTYLIIKLIMKMVNKLVSESVEDLVVKVLLYGFMHIGQRIYVKWSRLRTFAGLRS